MKPENWQHFRDRGHAYAALGRFDRADADHARAFALIPADEAHSYLRNRVAELRRIDRQEHPRILADINGYLSAQSAGGLEGSELTLAAQAAHSLELRGNTELAVYAYRGFADLIARSQDESLSDIAKQMRGAVRRLSLVGNEIEYQGHKLDGSPFNGTSCRGKAVLIHFWSTRYTNWQQEFLNLKKHYQLYGKRGFQIVTVNVDQGRPPAGPLPDDDPIPWIVLQADALRSQPADGRALRDLVCSHELHGRSGWQSLIDPGAWPGIETVVAAAARPTLRFPRQAAVRRFGIQGKSQA